MNKDRALKFIDILLNEGVSGFLKKLPKNSDENYCCIVDSVIYIFENKKWQKITVNKNGLTIWNKATESLWQYFEVGNEWKELEVDLLKSNKNKTNE